ncbi:phospholipase A [Sulfurospirillum arcachonense]|uniref:phospholipase A n=1 Tax=Sulfurospirillum arcachonense TaxID=57666 RepID=UPI00046AEECA|nr:phospholipase A [Sulfurospirillum arcachonense]
MNKKISLIIIALFANILFANEATDAFNTAKIYEQNGDLKKAMLFYKKAAFLAIEPKIITPQTKQPTIVKYGKNEIDSYGDKETDETVKQIIFSAFDIEAYKLNYLLPVTYNYTDHEGRENFETKFQLSFKKNLATNLLGMDEKLYLAYTQTSWWQTSQTSSPFRETNYEPELFMIFPYKNAKTALKAYKIGLVHQSNGQDSIKSRSWNRVYLTGIFQYSGIFFEPRAWYRFEESEKTNTHDGDDNPDIHNFLGYGDLKVSYPYKKHLFSVLLRNNLRFDDENKGAIQFDWTFPIPWINDAYGYVQIFSGYGESLIDYDKSNDRIGLGFSLTR